MVPISFLKLAPGPFPPPLPTKDTVARFVEGFFVLFCFLSSFLMKLIANFLNIFKDFGHVQYRIFVIRLLLRAARH